MKRILSLIMIGILFISYQLGVQASDEVYNKPVQTYTSDIGLEIISYSYNWDSKEKLKTVYEELLNNFHAEEIYYLSKIYIYPDKTTAAGYYYDDYEIDKNGRYKYSKDTKIELFNGDQCEDVSDFARILAHEYGHHFTSYYLITKENKSFASWKDTQYAKIRGLDKYEEVHYKSLLDKDYDHKWDVSEIAAEDYVQLFGSELAKKSVDYKDCEERVNENIEKFYYYSSTFNLLPQENFEIPLAADVDGLYEYWLDLAGYNATQDDLPQSVNPNNHNLTLTSIRDVYKDYKQYSFNWNKPDYTNDQIEYTLIMYPYNDYSFPRPVKTVTSLEETSATFGSAYKKVNDNKAKVITETFKGEYVFRLFSKDKNNFIHNCDELRVNFNKNGTVSICSNRASLTTKKQQQDVYSKKESSILTKIWDVLKSLLKNDQKTYTIK